MKQFHINEIFPLLSRQKLHLPLFWHQRGSWQFRLRGRRRNWWLGCPTWGQFCWWGVCPCPRSCTASSRVWRWALTECGAPRWHHIHTKGKCYWWHMTTQRWLPPKPKLLKYLLPPENFPVTPLKKRTFSLLINRLIAYFLFVLKKFNVWYCCFQRLKYASIQGVVFERKK